ncbi:GGDEF domain-containing protein [Burkholderia sp. LMU1-1-1.1]|uniref:GGDEF domain-containing protein n=1 Tax=Burkholderia sp. LMU1-1-1.1 TaxID=3135266 RepID=UPI0034200438
MPLDPATIVLMSTVMAVAMSVVLYSAHSSFPREIKGLKQWAISLVLLAFGSGIYASTSGLLGNILSPLCANAVILWGLGFGLIGTQMFYSRECSWWLFHFVWTLGMVTSGYYVIVNPDYSGRLAIFSILAFVLYSYQVVLIWGYGERHFSTVFFGVLMLFQSVVVLIRGVLAMTHSSDDMNLSVNGPHQNLYLLTSHFMTLLLTVGFMTVATRRLQTILERRSTLDPLTQVLNRRGFTEMYAKEHALMRREQTVMAMLSIDLDYFKAINDCYGHSTGDRVLADVAAVIAKALRASDHVARFGGEEFIVLLPATGLERAHHVAERIQTALRAPRSETESEQSAAAAALPPYTVSIGIACQVSPDEDLDNILLRADRALYCAKERGRDRIEIAAEAVLPLHASA